MLARSRSVYTAFNGKGISLSIFAVAEAHGKNGEFVKVAVQGRNRKAEKKRNHKTPRLTFLESCCHSTAFLSCFQTPSASHSAKSAMANQGVAYGLSAQIKKKLDGKRDAGQEAEVLDWIEAITGEKLEREKGYENILQNGIVLCKLMNKIKPGSVKKINDANSMPFKIMENISAFQNAIKAYGVPTTDVFQTVDLYEKKDISQVTQCLFALGRTCQVHPEFTGPVLGPKLSEENKREFSEEQLNASKAVIGLQAGYNKGASQAGMNFGKGRMIVD